MAKKTIKTNAFLDIGSDFYLTTGLAQLLNLKGKM